MRPRPRGHRGREPRSAGPAREPRRGLSSADRRRFRRPDGSWRQFTLKTRRRQREEHVRDLVDRLARTAGPPLCSMKIRPTRALDPIAQRLEQATHNRLVPGSNPGGVIGGRRGAALAWAVARGGAGGRRCGDARLLGHRTDASKTAGSKKPTDPRAGAGPSERISTGCGKDSRRSLGKAETNPNQARRRRIATRPPRPIRAAAPGVGTSLTLPENEALAWKLAKMP